jgi:sigma-E factor negative regulatory protein RseC
MIEADARVLSISGGRVQVEAEAGRSSSCGHCNAAGSCGVSLFARLSGKRRVQVDAFSDLDVRVGDRVVVGLPERVMTIGSIRLYLLPLLGLFGGALLGQALDKAIFIDAGEPCAIIGGLLGLLVVPIWLRRHGAAVQAEKHQPLILRKLSQVVPLETAGLCAQEEKT